MTGRKKRPAAAPAADTAGSPAAALTTTRELRVRQIGLELQNAELRQARLELEESRSRYLDLYHLAPVGYCTLDKEGQVVEANLALCSLLGAARETLLHQAFSRYVRPEDASAYRLFSDKLHDAKEPGAFELRMVRHDGTPFWGRLTATSARDADGAAELRLALGDVTERKQAESSLRTLSRAVEQSPASIIITDRNGLIEYVNPHFERITGYRSDEVLGRNPRLLKSGVTPARTYEVMWKTISEGGEWRGELCNRSKNGELYWESAAISGLRDEDGEVSHYIAVKENITDRKREEANAAALQSHLMQTQRLESLGLLAGGVSHEFNNLLAVIMGNTELALRQVDESQPLHADLLQVHQAAVRSAELTRQLLVFARSQPVAPAVLDLNATVPALLTILRRVIRGNVEIVWQPAERLWPTMMDPGQMDQILTNLVVNARHAIAGRGSITISTANHIIDADYCATHADAEPGEYVGLAVSDTGSGMDEATVARIYEPFFTTKAVGQGTGLGLAMVYGSVKQCRGFMTVASAPGEGTTFEIYLPRHVGA